MKEEFRKSAVDLTDLAIGIVVLGVVVSIGATILINIRDNRLTDLATVTTVNETLTTVTETGERLTNVWVKSVNSCLSAINGTTIPTSQYSTSIDSTTGTATVSFLTGGNATYPNNTNWKCAYTWYNTSRDDWALPNKSAIGLGEYGNWFKIIVIVGVAAVILALIFMAFGGKRAEEGIGGSY